jgi:threonine dehydrogenase-like Zn-dependent dehydrogenase
MRVPAGSLVHLPDEIIHGRPGYRLCTGTAYRALVRLDSSARDTLAVFGVGPVGMFVVQLATAMGARVIAADIDQSRVNRALGASDAIDLTETDAVDEIRKLTGGKGPAARWIVPALRLRAKRPCAALRGGAGWPLSGLAETCPERYARRHPQAADDHRFAHLLQHRTGELRQVRR